jgi:putative exporter of polyketide antibiotics
MAEISLAFPQGTYSSTSKPSVITLKTDLMIIQNYLNANTITAYAPAGAGTTTVDLSLSRINVVTMPAATQTIAVSNGSVGDMFVIEIINTTSQGALTWFTTIKWVDGVTPTLTGTNGKKDSFGFRITTAGNYDGYIIGQNI